MRDDLSTVSSFISPLEILKVTSAIGSEVKTTVKEVVSPSSSILAVERADIVTPAVSLSCISVFDGDVEKFNLKFVVFLFSYMLFI